MSSTSPEGAAPKRFAYASWHSLTGAAVLAGLIQHAATLIGAWWSTRHRPGLSMQGALTAWDGRWYLQIVAHGYPTGIVYTQGKAYQSDLAFFPGYPLLVKALDQVLPGGSAVAALVASGVCGVAASVLFGILVRRHWGAAAGRRAAVTLALFPGSFVFGMAYAEGLMLCAAIAALLLAEDRRWLLAGFAGAIATATRPNGVEITAGLAVLAAHDFRTSRSFRSLAAPVVSILGIATFFGYLRLRTGDVGAWFHMERAGWGQTNDVGQTAVRTVINTLTGKTLDFASVILAGGAVLTVVLLVLLVRVRPGAPILATAAVGVAIVLSGVLGARPRLVLGTFPLLIAPPVLLKGWRFAVWAATSVGIMSVTALVLMPPQVPGTPLHVYP